MTLGKAAKWMSTLSLSLILAACGGDDTDTDTDTDTGSEDSGTEEVAGDFDASSDIHVITREDGSGTRTAFTEIAGVVDENDDDIITPTATVQNGTNAVMQGVAGDVYSIGYISLVSLNDSVKAVSVNGVAAEADLVASGEYEVARNFNVT